MRYAKLYWEDVTADGSMPPLVKDPIQQIQLTKYAGASGDFNPIHQDDAFEGDRDQHGPVHDRPERQAPADEDHERIDEEQPDAPGHALDRDHVPILRQRRCGWWVAIHCRKFRNFGS